VANSLRNFSRDDIPTVLELSRRALTRPEEHVGNPIWATKDELESELADWDEPPETTLLVDASDPERRGGTGVTVDWIAAAALARERRVVLAGGLTPSNVAEAIAVVQPFGVDVSSGVEQSPGVKDFDKVARFVASARSAFEKQ
jgi:phosphoribosylanthranilate isomerase